MRIPPDSFAFTILLGLLSALPPLSIDMGLPALAEIGAALHVDAGRAAQTLSVFLVGFSLAPLVYGPMSDRFGRRPVLLAGCLLFALTSLACTAAPTLPVLLLSRFLQGAGAGAGTTLSVAIVRDLYEGHVARARLSYVGTIRVIAPMIAPTLGVLVLGLGGWRAIYAVLAAGGAVLLGIVALGLSESAPRRAPGGVRHGIVASYLRVLRNRSAIAHAVINALSFGCQFAFVTGSPLVFIQLMHVSKPLFGLMFALNAGGIMAGSVLNGRLAVRHVSPAKPLVAGLVLGSLGAVAAVALSLFGIAGPTTLMVCILATSLAYGLIGPNAAHGAVHPLPEIAGVAAAVLGALQMMVGAGSGALVAALFDGSSALAMTGVMAAFACTSTAVYLVAIGRRAG